MPITRARTSPPCGGRIAAEAEQGAKIRPSIKARNNEVRKKEPAPLNEMLIALPLTCAFCDGAHAAPPPPCPPRLAGKARAHASRLFQRTCRRWMLLRR